MKIAITGALGHIGSRLLQCLPEEIPVSHLLLIDNFASQRYCSLFNLSPKISYQFKELDVAAQDLTGIFEGYDVVVHLAAITNATASFEQKEQVERMNFAATRNVADACEAALAKMLYVSTTSVYGSQKQWVDETCTTEELQPQSPYAETKLREENYLNEKTKENPSFRFITCRFGTIFGISPGMRYHTAVNKFCWQATLGQSLTVWRTAYDQMRPYLDLEDAMRAIGFIIRGDHFDGEIYNVLTLNAAVQDIVSEIRHSIPDVSINFVDAAIMNQLSYRVSNRKFEALGFQFKGSLERGIFETISLLQGIGESRLIMRSIPGKVALEGSLNKVRRNPGS
jgi:nucleoside-diphosphate-sugar epimerase